MLVCLGKVYSANVRSVNFRSACYNNLKNMKLPLFGFWFRSKETELGSIKWDQFKSFDAFTLRRTFAENRFNENKFRCNSTLPKN